MYGTSNPSPPPSTFYHLGLCIHIIAFVMVGVALFTPYWSKITEFNGASTVVYDRGLIMSCDAPGKTGCGPNTDYSSDEMWASFVVVLVATIMAFITLQLFCVGLCVRSCKERNLGVPLTVLSVSIGLLYILAVVLFEIGIRQETTSGSVHSKDSFGFSRGLMVGAILLYLAASFFTVVDHYKRRKPLANNYGVQPLTKPNSFFDNSRGSNPKDIRSEVAVIGAAPIGPPPPPYNLEPDDGSPGMKECRVPGCTIRPYVTEASTFWGPGGIFNIKERLVCTSSNLVYAITCARDEKVFIGHSLTGLSKTVSIHLDNIRRRDMSDPVAVHFTQYGHSHLDLRVMALTSLQCDPDTKARLEKCLSYKMSKPHNSYSGFNKNFTFL